ncbi:hypothetical protein BCR36DRAFT_363010 [Piromyces finnis]|uniref:Inner centromere protein ARK-binding domain-containing protein n=1 Tax=Piromyces finnis TaxID=1754191 RepID=A0A1Y1UWT7_9FUNG|nr:hypothetical protein BCR36DRAFT_363010 [Piromyces finnis]|eukprot:ORX42099.1 hypothetical protein BCR36DRAFT_363010 [Piromyces finnis]
MAVVRQLSHQSHFILYFILQLCLISSQWLVQSQQVKITFPLQNDKKKSSSSVYPRRVILNKRKVPTRNVKLDRNSYLALLYVGGFSLCIICLILFPNLYRKPYHYVKNLLKNSKIHALSLSIKNLVEKVFSHIKHSVEIVLNIINIKLIPKMVLRLFQYSKSLIIFYSNKNVIYQWLMKEDSMSSDSDWDLESGQLTASSPLMAYSSSNQRNNSKNNMVPKNKKGNDHHHKRGSSNKLHHGSRNKPEALLPVTNSQVDVQYRIVSDPLTSPVSPDKVSNNSQQNVIVNTMTMTTTRSTPSTPDSITMKIDDGIPGGHSMRTNSREAVVEILEKSIPNDDGKMPMKSNMAKSSPNTFDFTQQELTLALSKKEHPIEYQSVQSVQNYNPYLTKPSASFPPKEETSQTNEGASKMILKNESLLKLSSSMAAGQTMTSLKVAPQKSLEDDKKIKGILVKKLITEDLENDGGAFEVVNKKRGKRTHKHSLSFSVPLTSTIEVPLKNSSHKRSSSSSYSSSSTKPTIDSVSVNNAIFIGNNFKTAAVKSQTSYSNAVQYSQKQLRKRSVSTPVALENKVSSSKVTPSPTKDSSSMTTKNENSAASTVVGHIRRYSTSIIDNKLSYADVLNSNIQFNKEQENDDTLKNMESLKKNNKKVSKNAAITRNGNNPSGNSENNKNPSNDHNNGSADQNNSHDQHSNQANNGHNTNGNNNSSGGSGGNNNGNNNNNNGNNNPTTTGKGKNKKQKKAKNANGNADENENEEGPTVSNPTKKKAAKVKKEAKAKNKVAAVDTTTTQGKANGNELKSPQVSKKKAAKAAANAKKKEVNKNNEESGLLVTGEITYGKAGLQDEPIPTDEEAYNALFSENATYWTPAERTERIKNSPFYDHNHHIAKYGKIKYKPMVEYDTDMNEINDELEMYEAAANEKGKKEEKKEKKKKKKANANANAASTSDDKDNTTGGNEPKKSKKKKAVNKDEEENEDSAEEKIAKSKKKGKTLNVTLTDEDATPQEAGKSEENKKGKKKVKAAVKAKVEANESASELDIPPVPAKAKKLKKAKKVAKKYDVVSESEEDSDSMSNSSLPVPTPILAPTATSESSLVYSSNVSTNVSNTRSTSPLSQSTTIQYASNGNEELLVNNNISGRTASLIFSKVSQPSPLSSVSYVNYYDDTNTTAQSNVTAMKPNPTPLAQSPVIPIQTPKTPLFGPSSTTPKMENPAMFSFSNGPSLTISNAPVTTPNPVDVQSQGQEETIIDLFNRTNKSFRRPRSISLNSHFQPSNENRSSLSPLLMSTFKNSSTLKLDQPFLSNHQQFNNIKLNDNPAAAAAASNNLPFESFESETGLFNSNSHSLSTSYLPPMHNKSSDYINKETIPAQASTFSTATNNQSGLNFFDFGNDGSSSSMANPIIKKPTENVIQRYRRARTLSSPAVPPSVDKKNHFYSPFMTGLDIKYDFYIPKSNSISPLSSSFTATDSHSYEMNREETTRRRSQSINERNRPNINDF